jgi:hypothetical protein
MMLCLQVRAQSDKPYYIYQIEAEKKIEDGQLYEACDIFMRLNKTRPLLGTDMITLLQTSVKCKHYKAFNTAVKWMHNNTYEPIMEFIPNCLAEDSALLKTDKQLNNILHQVTKTKPDFSHLDHESILFLNGLLRSDNDDRTINPDTSRLNGNIRLSHTDSVRFRRFSDYVDRKGFPKWTELGIYAGRMQTMLYHWTFLGMRGYEKESALFYKWVNLAKLMHQRVKDGEFNYGFYNNRIIGMIKWALTKSNREDDFKHFEPYTIF